ncbi:type I secretion system permease/ATPase [Oceanimonas marisflavi]|uniref:type I secretion system permease/ATPase n=1 Tax=Oceanimonas marisflavi TaxID=2059724 RepID=UPI000D3095E6|nr:type I secretion system permease/ATPase [Oceanimonas marisflavi]
MNAKSVFHRPLGRLWGAMAWVLLFSMAVNLLMLATPIYMLQVYDRVLNSRSQDTLLLLTLMVLVALATMAALEVVRGWLMVRLSRWLDNHWANELLAAEIRAAGQGGAPSVQGLRELERLRGFLCGPAVLALLDCPWVPVFLAFVFVLHPLLGWAASAGALVLFVLALLNQWLTRRLLAASAGAGRQAMERAEGAVRNADAIHAMGMMPQLLTHWRSSYNSGQAAQCRASERAGLVTAGSKFVRLGLQVMMLGAGAWLVIQGELTSGGMIAGSILMGRALAPVEQSIASWRTMLSALGAYRKVRAMLAPIADTAPALAMPEPAGKLTVEGLTYYHPGCQSPLLRGIGFELAPGEVLGIIGPSGAGKSTLVRLLLGNIRPQAGEVRLDGVEMSQWPSEEKGPHCGYLPQDVELFSGTVRQNIARMGEEDSPQILEAAQAAGCHQWILRLPQGYDTEIGDGGRALSGGERQRLALARALFGKPILVVLDEPGASLDNLGEQALQQAIGRLKERGATVVLIGHRPATMQQVDKVLVLQQGQVAAFGPREEVMAPLVQHAGGQHG